MNLKKWVNVVCLHTCFSHREICVEHFLLVRRWLLSNSKARVNVPLLLIHRSHEVVSHGDWTSSDRAIRMNRFCYSSTTRPGDDRKLSRKCLLWCFCGSSDVSEPILTAVVKSATFRWYIACGRIDSDLMPIFVLLTSTWTLVCTLSFLSRALCTLQ